MLINKITNIIMYSNIFFLFPLGLILNSLLLVALSKWLNRKSPIKYFITFVIINGMIAALANEVHYIQINFNFESQLCYIMQFFSDLFTLSSLISYFFLFLDQYLSLKRVNMKQFHKKKFYTEM